MILQDFDNKLINFIKKYSFISDPIFLFYPENIPENLDFSTGKLDLKYPNIDKALEKIDLIKKEYFEIIKLFNEVEILDNFLKEQYKKRLDEIGLIFEIIKHFYNEDETKKFELITKYFGVDLDFCKNEVLKNKQIIFDEFNALKEKSYLFDDIYKKIKNRLDEEVSDIEIKYYFEKALKFLKIDKYWKVVIDENAMSFVHGDFNNNGGTIFIPKNRTIKLSYLILLIIHEIDGHSKQFTNFGEIGLYKSIIRFSQAEEILEGLAIYLEYSFEYLILRQSRLENIINNFENRINFINGKITFDNFLNFYTKKDLLNRIFRGFRNIKNFINTKDLIYTQGIYKIIKYKNKYGDDLFEKIYSGVINAEYIEKDCKRGKDFEVISFLKNSSAFYILTKIIG
ncbi:MAG: DUF1704 domain-containing protein [Candidatus Gracilibacteria bacterium]|nr:DUF1704 domain-containing protein [Candidatus Gracilibacteria bacterium]